MGYNYGKQASECVGLQNMQPVNKSHHPMPCDANTTVRVRPAQSSHTMTLYSKPVKETTCSKRPLQPGPRHAISSQMTLDKETTCSKRPLQPGPRHAISSQMTLDKETTCSKRPLQPGPRHAISSQMTLDKETTCSKRPLQPGARHAISSQMTLDKETTWQQRPHFEGLLSGCLRQVSLYACINIVAQIQQYTAIPCSCVVQPWTCCQSRDRPALSRPTTCDVACCRSASLAA